MLALAAQFWSAPLPSDSVAALRLPNDSANRNKNVRICRPNCLRPATLSRSRCWRPPSATRGSIPAVRRRPAPLRLPVAQPVMTTNAPGTRSPAISDVVRNSGSAARAVASLPAPKAISPCSRLAAGKEHMRGQMDHRRPLLQAAAGRRPAAPPDPAAAAAVPPPATQVCALDSTSSRLPTRRCSWPVGRTLGDRSAPARVHLVVDGIAHAQELAAPLAAACSQDPRQRSAAALPERFVKYGYPLNTPCCRPAARSLAQRKGCQRAHRPAIEATLAFGSLVDSSCPNSCRYNCRPCRTASGAARGNCLAKRLHGLRDIPLRRQPV